MISTPSTATTAPAVAVAVAPSEEDVSGRLLPFPQRVHRMLQYAERHGKSHIVSWIPPFGRAFKVHRPNDFIEEVASVYFNLTQYQSFQRQLLNYGFLRIEGGSHGAYCLDVSLVTSR